jgi:hypothetical protein
LFTGHFRDTVASDARITLFQRFFRYFRGSTVQQQFGYVYPISNPENVCEHKSTRSNCLRIISMFDTEKIGKLCHLENWLRRVKNTKRVYHLTAKCERAKGPENMYH